MMFPALRGGNDNPGIKEGFLGEVDDVLAAAALLRRQPYVDPDRIYLGGHSTGGTMVLIVAELSDRFRAIFSFGPADDVRGYPDQFTPFDRRSRRMRLDAILSGSADAERPSRITAIGTGRLTADSCTSRVN